MLLVQALRRRRQSMGERGFAEIFSTLMMLYFFGSLILPMTVNTQIVYGQDRNIVQYSLNDTCRKIGFTNSASVTLDYQQILWENTPVTADQYLQNLVGRAGPDITVSPLIVVTPQGTDNAGAPIICATVMEATYWGANPAYVWHPFFSGLFSKVAVNSTTDVRVGAQTTEGAFN